MTIYQPLSDDLQAYLGLMYLVPVVVVDGGVRLETPA